MADFQTDLARGRYDVKFFALRFLGIELHPGQVRMAEAYMFRDPTGWRAAYLTIAVAAGNRAGKTLALAIVIMHSCIYKMGSKPPQGGSAEEVRQWRVRPYMWFHFAIAQEIADLVYTEIVMILQGTHGAQHDGRCPLSEEVPHVAEWTKAYHSDYRWIVFDSMFGGAEIHFRTTGERALGSLGRDMHGLSFDECGLESRLDWIIKNVLQMRRLGTGGQLFLISTPEEGLTEFSDYWFAGDPEQPDRSPRKFSMRMSSRENLGYGLDQDMFDALVGDMDEDQIKQNVDGYFIQGRSAFFNHTSVDHAFVEGLPETVSAKNKHAYIQGVDPALAVDSLWSMVFDATKAVAVGVSAQRVRGKKTVDGIVALTQQVHYSYEVNRKNIKSSCATAVDATGYGGKMFKDLLDEGIPGGVRAIEFGASHKRKLLGDLRSSLDKGLIKMPRTGIWLAVRRQLLGYKLDDKHIEQDAVMALACAVSEIRRNPPGGLTSVPFDAYATGDPPIAPDWVHTPYE